MHKNNFQAKYRHTYLLVNQSIISGSHAVPDTRQPGAPGDDDQDPGRHSIPPREKVQGHLLPQRAAGLGLEPASSQVCVPALPTAAPVPPLWRVHSAGAGGGRHVGPGGPYAGLRSRLQANAAGDIKASLL